MSGRWAKACDAQAIDGSHTSPARSAQLALTWITHALIAIEDGDDPRWAIERAGAYVRAWRKSLPDQGEREAPGLFPSTAIQIAGAGQCVLRAVAMMAGSELSPGVHLWLRPAEAELRDAWKWVTR